MPPRTITSYRVLPPKARIIYPEGSKLTPQQRELQSVDTLLEQVQPRMSVSNYAMDDILSRVFANQVAEHAGRSSNLAHLIAHRYTLAQKHLSDIQCRLDEMLDRKPLRLEGLGFYDDHRLTEVEKQILDLERQQRAIQTHLWRDVLDLRKELLDERREYRATQNRMNFLGGGIDGSYK